VATTIRDVARLAGVGSGTVSRVINNSPKVDPVTRARVLRAIAELDFHPSASARRLSTGRTQSVGVVAPFMTRASAIERIRGIEGVLSTTGYDLVVFNIETIDRRDTVLADVLRGNRVDGVVLLGLVPHAHELDVVERTGLPVVLLDAHHPRVPRVVINDLDGAHQAVCHLVDLGHRRIAYLGELPRVAFNIPASRIRHRGVRQALQRAGLELTPANTAIGYQGRTRARELARRLLRQRERPTAIICASDLQAIGVLEAAREAGVDVPGELSVIGYDDLEIAAHVGLTTIRQPLFESGIQAARLLVDRIDRGRMQPVREVVDVTLVARDTTGPAAAGETRGQRRRRYPDGIAGPVIDTRS
jgi:DNA-binding LacI/PurR family transcriptional regulator